MVKSNLRGVRGHAPMENFNFHRKNDGFCWFLKTSIMYTKDIFFKKVRGHFFIFFYIRPRSGKKVRGHVPHWAHHLLWTCTPTSVVWPTSLCVSPTPASITPPAPCCETYLPPDTGGSRCAGLRSAPAARSPPQAAAASAGSRKSYLQIVHGG